MGGHHLKIFLQEFQELNQAASVGGGGGREVEVGRAGASAGGLCSAALPCMTQWRHQLHTCSRQTSCPHICPPPPTPLPTERHRASRGRCKLTRREKAAANTDGKSVAGLTLALATLGRLLSVALPSRARSSLPGVHRATETQAPAPACGGGTQPPFD